MTEKKPIIRSSNQRGGLNPPAVETLSLELTSPSYHLEYQLRHPFGIYNVSLNRVLSSFEDLSTGLAAINERDLLSNKGNPKWDANLLHSLEKLLYALMEHMDDCENILRCFFPPGTKINKEISIKAYQSSVDSYRTHIGKVVNHLKHKQGRLYSIGMFIGDIPHLGYFVEGTSEDGSLGPAPNIHARGSTAFSYARDIRYHLYNLYYVSAKLSEAVETIASPFANKVAYEIGDNNTNLEKILSHVAELPMVVFPDEIQKDFPFVAVDHVDETIIFTTSMKRHPHGLRTGPSPTRFVAFFKGDGVTRSFRIPYGR